MTWSYIAGFFDGEGHVGTEGSNRNYLVSMSQATTRREVIDNISSFLGKDGIRHRFSVKAPCVSHPRGHLTLIIDGYEPVYKFLQRVIPSLIVKYIEALVMLDRCDIALRKSAARNVRLRKAVIAYTNGMGLKEIRRVYHFSQPQIKNALAAEGKSLRPRGIAIRLYHQRQHDASKQARL